MLRNHGILTVGANVGQAFYRMYRLEQACRLQVAATSGGGKLYPVAAHVVANAPAQALQVASREEMDSLVWSALKRKLARTGVDYES
jgi:ribulose-5-phosphate 4-epimerase/fuculose-1-phosphate aldolase